MKIINKLCRIKPLNNIEDRANSNFYKYIKRYFSLPLSFKNKINSFFKYVHPDVLGEDTPDDYRRMNEKSIQEVNSYLENLSETTNFFERKTLYFYVKIEKKLGKENGQNLFEKISIDLENLKPEMTQSNKFAIRSK